MSQGLLQFGERLLERGDVSIEQLEEALRRQQANGRPLGETLLEMEVLDEARLLERLEEHFDVPHVVVDRFDVDADVLELIPPETCRRLQVFPLFRDHDVLIVAMPNPNDVLSIEEVERETGRTVEALVCRNESLERAIEQSHLDEDGDREALSQLSEEFGGPGVAGGSEAGTGLEESPGEEGPVVRAVRLILEQAIRRRTTDIHIEPNDDGLRIRFRIDGFLRDVPAPDFRMHAALVSRIKVLANMDISENRVPQDGQFKFPIDGRQVDVRASVIPTVVGENIVLRVLDDRGQTPSLADLGVREPVLTRYRQILDLPWGMVLVTGPTGSGKTTTLYSSLREVEDPRRHVITIEDPVESVLPGCRQIQVRAKSGLTFARGLRAVLRHDPDIIMVGEIRDGETAEIATQAALTGHLILATLHTNDAASAVTRLVDLGVPPFLVEGALAGVVAQRLVRVLCSECKKPELLRPADYPALAAEGIVEPFEAFGPGSCRRCSGSGYDGRTAIHELFVVDDTVREGITSGASASALRRMAREAGGRSLGSAGLELVREGATSLDEVLRVAGGGAF